MVCCGTLSDTHIVVSTQRGNDTKRQSDGHTGDRRYFPFVRIVGELRVRDRRRAEELKPRRNERPKQFIREHRIVILLSLATI